MTLQHNVAIVGAGLMGQWHAQFARSCGAQVTAVVDSDRAAARSLADKVACQSIYTDAQEMLRADALAQVVHICTPSETHQLLVGGALDCERHVLVEKPLAQTLAATEQLLMRAHDKGRLLNPVHQFPFQRGFQELIARLPDIGEPVRISFFTCSSGGDGRAREQRRQILLEILPHPLSLVSRLLPAAVEPGQFRVIKFTDHDLELGGEVGGAFVSIAISLRGRPTRNELTVIGTKSSAHVDLFHGYALFEGGTVSRSAKILKPLRFGAGMFVKAGANLALRAARGEPAYPGLRELIARFYDAVEHGTAAPIDDAEVIAAAKFVDFVRDSAAVQP